MSLDFYTCYLILFISQLGTVTSDRCSNECLWGSWEPWKCEQCCQVWSGRDAAYRYRSICCSTESDINSCLRKCNFYQNQTTENGMCTRYCPCSQQPIVTPPMAWPPKLPVTLTPTPAHPNLPPIYQTGLLTRTRVVGVASLQTTTNPTSKRPQPSVVTTAPSPQTISSVNSTIARVSSVANIQSTNNPTDKLTSTNQTRRPDLMTTPTSKVPLTPLPPKSVVTTPTAQPTIPFIRPTTTSTMARISSFAHIQSTNNPTDKLLSSYRARRADSTTTHRLQQNGRAVLHLMEIVDGTVSYDRVVSNQLGADAGDESSREVKCLTECRGRSDLYNCLVKCILSPCETLVNIAGPCLFLLGVIVGSSITCCITRIMRKTRDKKEQTSVQPLKAALNF